MDNENKEIEVIDTTEKFLKFFKDIRIPFEEIEEKRCSSDENDLSRVAELIIENFGHACSLEEMEDLSELIINLANLKNPKKVRITIAKKLNFKFFYQTLIGYKTYEKLLLTLNNDPDEEIQKLILNLSNGNVNEHLSKVKSDPQHVEAVSKCYKAILLPFTLSNFTYTEILRSLTKITPFWEEDEYKSFEYNWLGLTPYNLMKKLYEEYKKGNEEEVKKFFFKMLNKRSNIEKIKNNLKKSDIFKSRLDIIEDALDAHLDGKYTLSIPILLSQIDGIMIKELGDILKGKYKGKKCPECGRYFSPIPNAKNIALELLNELDWENSSYYLKFIKNDYNKNRIPIVHGLKTDYPDPHYSTKLILVLYKLFELLNEDIHNIKLNKN